MRTKKEEKKFRSLVKSVTYRVLIIVSMAVITWILTNNWELTVGITSVATIVNTILYYIHERIWTTISWGK